MRGRKKNQNGKEYWMLAVSTPNPKYLPSLFIISHFISIEFFRFFWRLHDISEVRVRLRFIRNANLSGKKVPCLKIWRSSTKIIIHEKRYVMMRISSCSWNMRISKKKIRKYFNFFFFSPIDEKSSETHKGSKLWIKFNWNNERNSIWYPFVCRIHSMKLFEVQNNYILRFLQMNNVNWICEHQFNWHLVSNRD